MTNNPIAIVTGAGGGIGRVISETLAGEGWTVIVNDISQEHCQQTVDSIILRNGRAIAIAADVSDEASVIAFFSQVKQNTGQSADLLVNNAGIQTWSTLTELSVEDWNNTIATNLTGCFLMTKYFAIDFANASNNSSASIINIGSGCNTLAFPKLVDYSASKGGIEMLTKSAALELGPKHIRVNCIAPGAITTERTAAETDGDYNKSWSEITPLQRVGNPQDVANAVSLLSDPRASFITGQTIGVDGGLFSRSVWPAGYN